jgi:hypothetical protein
LQKNDLLFDRIFHWNIPSGDQGSVVVWAITSYYNPVRYNRRLSNYRLFRTKLDVPLVTVELSFDGRFDLKESDADILIQISGGAVLWQKERLLNVALRAVPSEVNRIAWIDCDLILECPDWVENATRQLDKFDLVQLFSDAIHLKSEEYQSTSLNAVNFESVPGIAGLSDAREVITVQSNRNYYQSGFAWAAKRQLLEEHGFYDAAIIGGGDCMMVAAVFGQFDGIAQRFLLNEMRRRHYMEWAVPFHDSVAERIGQVPGTIYHLSHGDLKNRRYGDRHVSLSAHDFDPGVDLRVGTHGAWEWARPKLELETFLKSYFVDRAEDA